MIKILIFYILNDFKKNDLLNITIKKFLNIFFENNYIY